MPKQTFSIPTSEEILEQFREDILPEFLAQARQMIREELAMAGRENTHPNNKPGLTQKELSAHLKVTPQTIIRWKKRKMIPFYTVGTAIRYDLEKVNKALVK
jgi:hypothetical protein